MKYFYFIAWIICVFLMCYTLITGSTNHIIIFGISSTQCLMLFIFYESKNKKQNKTLLNKRLWYKDRHLIIQNYTAGHFVCWVGSYEDITVKGDFRLSYYTVTLDLIVVTRVLKYCLTVQLLQQLTSSIETIIKNIQ